MQLHTLVGTLYSVPTATEHALSEITQSITDQCTAILQNDDLCRTKKRQWYFSSAKVGYSKILFLLLLRFFEIESSFYKHWL